MTYDITATEIFTKWQSKLKDRNAARAIAMRLVRAENGNLGDVVSVGDVVKLKGVANMAEETGLNRESLYKAFNGQAQPKWDTVHRLFKAIGVRLEIAA